MTAPYRVVLWDTWKARGDEDEAAVHGAYATWETALEEAQRMVLATCTRVGFAYARYLEEGVEPSVEPAHPVHGAFDARAYARQLCEAHAAGRLVRLTR